MKPRIIVLMHYMELGGAEMALLGLLNAFDPQRVDVDLFVHSHQGPLMQYIPKWINLLSENAAYSVVERPMAEAVRKGQFGVVAGRVLARLRHKLWRSKHPATGADAAIFQYVGNCVEPFVPKINPSTEYDLCISFLNPHNFGLTKVRAKQKLAWIHTDYATISINTDMELPIWGGYDYIASISPDVTTSFVSAFPTLATKILPMENILPKDYVKARADERDVTSEMPPAAQVGGGVTLLSIGRYTHQKNFDNVPSIAQYLMNLLSIGRFSHAKNYDNVPDICHRMVQSGIADLKWYIIGYGGDEELIRQRIAEAGMHDHVILLGKKENPYPYIKACDIYVQPSRYEGKSMTVREAQLLGKPVVITAYPTAASQVEHAVDGYIVPLDNEGCARGLAEFICNTSLQEQIRHNLLTRDYANLSEVEKIYALLNA